MKIILVNFTVSLEQLLRILKLICFCINEINIAPNTPRDAASDGVAIPSTIEPRTKNINNIGGKKLFIRLKLSSMLAVIFRLL